MPGNLWLRTVHFDPLVYTRQRPNFRQTVYFTRRRNGRGESSGRCLNMFTSPFHLAPPAHTATRSANQESASWITSEHMTDHWKSPSSFRGTADDDDDDDDDDNDDDDDDWLTPCDSYTCHSQSYTLSSDFDNVIRKRILNCKISLFLFTHTHVRIKDGIAKSAGTVLC